MTLCRTQTAGRQVSASIDGRARMGRPAEAGTRRGLTALGVKDLKGIAGTVRAWAALRQAIADKLPGFARKV